MLRAHTKMVKPQDAWGGERRETSSRLRLANARSNSKPPAMPATSLLVTLQSIMNGVAVLSREVEKMNSSFTVNVMRAFPNNKR